MEPSFEYLYFLGVLKEKILIIKYSESHIVCIKLIKKAYCGHGRISKKVMLIALLYLPVWQFFFCIKCLFIISSRFLLTEFSRFNKTGKSIFLYQFLTALINVKIFLMSFLGQLNVVVNHKHVQKLPLITRLEGWS